MNAKISVDYIEDIIKQAHVKNPFRYSSVVAKDFALDQSEEAEVDVFAQFLLDELKECADAPKNALSAVRMDILAMSNILKEMKANDVRLSHPFFCPAQVSILHTYLDGDCCGALEKRTKKKALEYVNGIMADRLLRLCLAAVDIRNGHSHLELPDMFEEAAGQVCRLEYALDKMEAPKEERSSPRIRP